MGRAIAQGYLSTFNPVIIDYIGLMRPNPKVKYDMRPFLDMLREPPPAIIERMNVPHPTFGFKLLDVFDIDCPLDGDAFFVPRAREAYIWLTKNAVGQFRTDPEQKTIGNYVNIQIADVRDVVLFKTYWL